MPCFKGVAVSVHADGAPLPEYGVQKQSRVSRVNTYIPVPKPRIPKDSITGTPEPAKFAISITLLTPGLAVPYSTPKASDEHPYPKPQIVNELPAHNSDKPVAGINPYIPLTNSENETIAAYIYFDGRPKEEVATLLRPSEETWVNSRWVQVPDSEGGGLAEREFLFKEVALDRWLKGLDLEGKDAAAKIERRRQKFERRRSRRKNTNGSSMDMGESAHRREHVLRYGDNGLPIEEEVMSDESSDDDEPPEAAGQIKVAMFRVLASGEIKKGEYSPQFDAHDDDEDVDGMKDANGDVEADVDHTTSFAKPKALDPKSISTQTVTGIDGPDKPYAVFTFFYRGERQLQKMGLLDSSKKTIGTPASAKRSSRQIDFSGLGPLKSGGTVGYTQFRDSDPAATRKSKARKTSKASAADDSDEDDEDDEPMVKMEDDADDTGKGLLSPEDAGFTGELADGLTRIKLKRQHSATPLDGARDSPASASTPAGTDTPAESAAETAPINITNNMFGKTALPNDGTVVGSPLKKARALTFGEDDESKKMINANGAMAPIANILSMADTASGPTLGSSVFQPGPPLIKKEEAEIKQENLKEEDEEL